jgi:hypothetical protein
MVTKRSAFWLVVRRLVLVALAVLVLAYPASRMNVFEWPRAYDPLAIPDLNQPPSFMTGWQMKLVDAEPENCLAALAMAGRPVRLESQKPAPARCEKSGTVLLQKLSVAKVRTEETRCAVAARLYAWEKQIVVPAARRYLGRDVVEILHFGSYSCRPIRGRRSMSEHATANAFDISGFKLADRRVISLKRHWNGTGAEAQFLREVRDGLCDWFNATLSPDYNADHADHFHVDMGWWQTCR